MSQIWGGQKKVLHKNEEKMHKKMKITYQRAENLVRVQQHYSISFYEKIFFIFRFISGVQTKVHHKIEEKMHKKIKITYQRAKNLVRVQQHYSISFYEKIFFYS